MLKVHFLNVGHGDCTIIEHPNGHLTVIDINNATDLDARTNREISRELSISYLKSQYIAHTTGKRRLDEFSKSGGYNIDLINPIEFLKRNYPGRDIFRYIQTHPDLDHMRGLSALRNAGISIINFWDNKHKKRPKFNSISDMREWIEYRKLGNEKDTAKVLHLFRGSNGDYWNRDKLEILSPTPSLLDRANEKENWNNMSYVLRLSYKGCTIIFGADAEQDTWDDIVQCYGNKLKCNILKASHHGRDSGYHQMAVELMSPQYTIVSVGKKPDTDASNKYKNYSDHVWSTRWRGTITLEIDDSGNAFIYSEYDR